MPRNYLGTIIFWPESKNMPPKELSIKKAGINRLF